MQQNDQDQYSDFDDLNTSDMIDDTADDGVYEQPVEDRDAGLKKRKKIFIGAVGFIVILGAVMGWMIMSQDNTVSVPAPAPQPATVAAAPTPPPAAPAATTPAPLPSGVTADASTLVEPLQPVTAAPSDAQSAEMNPGPAMPSPATPEADGLLPAPDQAAVTDPAAPIDAAASTEATPPVQALPDPQTTERLATMETQLQDLSAQLVALNSMPAPAPGTAPVVDNALSEKLMALTSQLEQMTSQLDALDQRTTTLATEVQNAGNTAEAATPAPQKIATKEKVIEVQDAETSEPSLSDEMPKPAEPVKKVAKAAPVKKAPVKKAASPTVVRSWELRSAQPGVAWLGRPGSGEMARYAVGENVPGLGSVRSVSQDANGNWVVNTSGGTIKQ